MKRGELRRPDRSLQLGVYSALPLEAASTRYRILQYLPALDEHGIRSTHTSYFSPAVYQRLYSQQRTIQLILDTLVASVRQVLTLPRIRSSDVVWIEREAESMGPPLVARAVKRLGKPLILDLDDALYAKSGGRNERSIHGRWISRAKCHWKFDRLIRMADHIVCGNPFVFDYCTRLVGEHRTSLIPTPLDTELVRPAERKADLHRPLILGWIGSHSTARYLAILAPVLSELARTHDFRLKVVGGQLPCAMPGVKVDVSTWKLATEVDELRTFDIGLYPLEDDVIANGKSAFKAVQYMAAGVPCICTPVGFVRDVISHGVNGYLAGSPEEWRNALLTLLSDPSVRDRISTVARHDAVCRFDFRIHAPQIAQLIHRLSSPRTEA